MELNALEKSVMQEHKNRLQTETGKKVTILGYVDGPSARDMVAYLEFTDFVRDKCGAKAKVSPVHPHDVLPYNMREKMANFRRHATGIYHIVYKVR